MILVLTFPALPLTTLILHSPSTRISTSFYMCHLSGPISILLMVVLGWLFRIYFPNHVCIIPCVQAVVFSSVFPLLSFFLCMWISFFSISPSELSWISALLLAEESITFDCTTVLSASVYNVLLVLLLSLCINSWRSFQFTWNSSSLLFLLSTIVFHHQQIPQFVQPFPN